MKKGVQVIGISLVTSLFVLTANSILAGDEKKTPLVSHRVKHVTSEKSYHHSSELLTLLASYVSGSLEISPDGEHYAYAIESNGGRRVVHDGAESQTFQNIGPPFFSPSGKVFFWVVSDGLARLSADGVVIQTTIAGNNEVVFSEDGAHWAALGGEPQTRGGTSVPMPPVVLYVDGVLVGRYSDLTYPDFSPDGKSVAFLALEPDDRMSLMVDGKSMRKFEKPKVECSFIFNTTIPGPNVYKQAAVHYLSDGTMLTLVRDTNGWTVYKGDKALSSYQGEFWGGGTNPIHQLDFKGSAAAAWIQFRSLVVAKNSPVAAWWEQPAGKADTWRVVVDGKPVDSIVSKSFWSADRPVLSPDGKRVAYVADLAPPESKKTEGYVVVDGKKNGPYANVWGIRFSDDGKHFAYASSDGTEGAAWTYYVDGKAIGGKFESVYPPALSANGAHVAWTATRDKKKVLVADGAEVGTAEDILWGPKVSKLGMTRWVVRDGSKVAAITVGGK